MKPYNISPKHNSSPWENFNPDCFMTPGELNEWIHYFGQGTNTLFADLRQYCLHKQRAMLLRLQGSIEEALANEKICDEIYERIPEDSLWKW